MKKIRLTVAVFAAAAAFEVWACSPYFQPTYMHYESPYMLRLHSDGAIKRFLVQIQDLLPEPYQFSEGTSTLKAECADFNAAVKKYFPDISREKAAELEGHFTGLLARHRNIPTHFAAADLPEELIEFQLFLEGRSYLFEKQPDHIPPAWEKLLALPPERRHYRTVWVHFMLGNYFKNDLHTHYDNCRNAVRQGFADTAGLALRSYTLEIRYGRNMVKVIRRAAEAEKNLALDKAQFLPQITMKNISKLDDGQYFALIQDPVCREYLAMIDNSPRFRMMVKNVKLRSADICAYYAYQDGDITEAKEFIALLPRPTMLSLYLEAKIARHDGNTPRAVKKLQQWLKMAENISPDDRADVIEISDGAYNTAEKFTKEVYGVLGMTMVMRRDFTDAAKFFLQAEQRNDLFLIAEKYMLLDDLAAFVDSIPAETYADKNSDEYNQPQIARDLRYLAARRAFREKRFDLAGKYLPDEYKKTAEQYVQLVADGDNTAHTGDQRALAYYNAAKILRLKGMELSGTNGEPDNFPGHYGLNVQGCTDCNYDVTLGRWKLCSNHRDHYAPGFNAAKNHNTIPHHMRFHYRYLAAEMALKAGMLAEDDELRALIHLFGGQCLKLRSPAEADIFYKRLVLNSRKTMLSKLADRQRWFPTIPVLQQEMSSTTPCPSVEYVHELMRKAFPEAK